MTSLTSSFPPVKPKKIKICGEGSVRIFARSLGSISNQLPHPKVKTNTKSCVSKIRTNSADNDAGNLTTPSGCIKELNSEVIRNTSACQDDQVRGGNLDGEKCTQSCLSDEVKHNEDISVKQKGNCDGEIDIDNLNLMKQDHEDQSSVKAHHKNSSCIMSHDPDAEKTSKETCSSVENKDHNKKEMHQNDKVSLKYCDHERMRMDTNNSESPENEASKTNQDHSDSSTNQDKSYAITNLGHNDSGTDQNYREPETSQDHSETTVTATQDHNESLINKDNSESRTNLGHSESRTNLGHSESRSNLGHSESRINQSESSTNQDHGESDINGECVKVKTTQDCSGSCQGLSNTSPEHNSVTVQDGSKLQRQDDCTIKAEQRESGSESNDRHVISHQDHDKLIAEDDRDHTVRENKEIKQSENHYDSFCTVTSYDQNTCTRTNDDRNISWTSQGHSKSERHNDFDILNENQNQNARTNYDNVSRTSQSYNTSRTNQHYRDSQIFQGGSRNMNTYHHNESRTTSGHNGPHHQTFSKSRPVSGSFKNKSYIHYHQAWEETRSYKRDFVPIRSSHDNKLLHGRSLPSNHSYDNKLYDDRSSNDHKLSHDKKVSHDNRGVSNGPQRHHLSNKQFEKSKVRDRFKTFGESENRFSYCMDRPKQKFSNYNSRFSQSYKNRDYDIFLTDCTTVFKKPPLQMDKEENWMDDLIDVSEIINHHKDSFKVERDNVGKLYPITEELFDNGKVLEPSVSDKIAISGAEDWSCDFDEILSPKSIRSVQIEQEFSRSESEMGVNLYDQKKKGFDLRCPDICHDQEVPNTDLSESIWGEVNFDEISGIKSMSDKNVKWEGIKEMDLEIDKMKTGTDVHRVQAELDQKYKIFADIDVVCDEKVTESTCNADKFKIDVLKDGEKCSDENRDVDYSDRECQQNDFENKHAVNSEKRDFFVEENNQLNAVERVGQNADQDCNKVNNLQMNSVEDNIEEPPTSEEKTSVSSELKDKSTENKGIEKSQSKGKVIGENIDEAHGKDIYIVTDSLISNDELNELYCKEGQVCASQHLNNDMGQSHGDNPEIFTDLEGHRCRSSNSRNVSESEDEKCLLEKLFRSDHDVSDNCTIGKSDNEDKCDMSCNVRKEKHKTKKKKKSKSKKKIPPCQISHLHVSVSEESEVVDIGETDYEKLVKNKLKALEKERSSKTMADNRISAGRKRKNKHVANKKSSDKSGTAASLFIDLMSALRKRNDSKLGTELDISQQEVNDLLNTKPTFQSSPKPSKDDKQWLQMAENWEHELILLNQTPGQDLSEKKISNISVASSENNDTFNTTESEKFFSCEDSKDLDETTELTTEKKTMFSSAVDEDRQNVSLDGCCRAVDVESSSDVKEMTQDEEVGFKNNSFSNSWEEQLKSLCTQRGTHGGRGFRKFHSGVAKNASGKHSASLNKNIDKCDKSYLVNSHASVPVPNLMRKDVRNTVTEGEQASCDNNQNRSQNVHYETEGQCKSVKNMSSDYQSFDLLKESQLTTEHVDHSNHTITDSGDYFTCNAIYGLPVMQENWENSLIEVDQYVKVKNKDSYDNHQTTENKEELCEFHIDHVHAGDKLDIEGASQGVSLLKTRETVSVDNEFSTESDNNRDAMNYYPLSENTLSEVLTISDFETSAAVDDVGIQIDETNVIKELENQDTASESRDKMSIGNPGSDPFDPWPGYLYGFKNNPVLSESLIVNPPHSHEKVSGINRAQCHKTVNRKNLFNKKEESISQEEQLVFEDQVCETNIPTGTENFSEPQVNDVSDEAWNTGDYSQYQYSGCVCPPYDVFFWIWRTCGCHMGHRPALCDIRAASNWYFPPYLSPDMYYSNTRENSQDADFKVRPNMEGAEVQEDKCETNLNTNNENIYRVRDESLNNTDYTSPQHKWQAWENIGKPFKVPSWMFTPPPPPPPPPQIPSIPNRALWARMNYWSRCPPPPMSLHSHGPRTFPRARWNSMIDGPPVGSPMHAHFITCNPGYRKEHHALPETKLCSSMQWSYSNVPPSKYSNYLMTSPDDKGQGHLSRKTPLEDRQTGTITNSKQHGDTTPQKLPGFAKKISNYTLKQNQQKMISDQNLSQKCSEVQNLNVPSSLGKFRNPYGFTYGPPPFAAFSNVTSGSCTRIQNNLAEEEDSASDEDVDLSSYDVSFSPGELEQIKMKVNEKNMMGRGRLITSRKNELQNKMEKNRIKHKRVAKLRYSPQQLVDYESSETEDSDEGKKICHNPTDGKIITETLEINDENNNVMDKRRKIDNKTVFYRRSTGRIEEWWDNTPNNDNSNVSKGRRFSDLQMYQKNKFVQELQNDNKVPPYVPPYRRKPVIKLDSESSDFDGEDSSDVSFSIASQEDSNAESSNLIKKQSQITTSNTSANSPLPFWASLSSSRESSPLCGYQPYSKPSISNSSLNWRNPRTEKNKNCSTDSEGTSSISQTDWKQRFKDRCRRYGVKYVDSHCHIDFLLNRQNYNGSWSQYLQENKDTVPDNYEGCVAVFCAPNSFRPEGGLWREVAKEENVWLAMGCHPKSATDFSPKAEEGLRRCLQHEKFVALGEIGLDYSGTFKQHEEIQKVVFSRQIKIALDYNKPLVIHCRDAEEECLEILEKMVPKNYKIHCHCFMGNFESAQKWLNLFPNLYIGLTPVVTYKTAVPTQNVARFIPLERLLLETDAPYFIPRSFPKHEVKYSHPGMAVVVAEAVARLRNCTVVEVLRHCRQNTKNMYGI